MNGLKLPNHQCIFLMNFSFGRYFWVMVDEFAERVLKINILCFIVFFYLYLNVSKKKHAPIRKKFKY